MYKSRRKWVATEHMLLCSLCGFQGKTVLFYFPRSAQNNVTKAVDAFSKYSLSEMLNC